MTVAKNNELHALGKKDHIKALKNHLKKIIAKEGDQSEKREPDLIKEQEEVKSELKDVRKNGDFNLY